jgi:tetraacyldisaccharide 4'-kinase
MQGWINKIWYGKHPFALLLLPLSALFYLVSSLRRHYLTWRLIASQPLNVPVIIVGNITVGGSGKTPMVIYLIELLRRHGYRPGVISRGYGAKISGVKLVNMTDTPATVGDEPAMILARTQVPMVVGADRINAARLLLQQGVDVIISDDGLQHYKLPRDIELVIIDGARRFGNAHLLPAGPLREGLWRLQSIDWLINNGGALQTGDVEAGETLMRLLPQKMRPVDNSDREFDANQVAVAIAGIGNPQRFFDSLTAQGITLSQTLAFDDHQAFIPQDLIDISSEQPLIMTEKDAIKCRSFAQGNWWYLPVDAQLSDEFNHALLARLEKLVLQKQQGIPNGI